MHGSVAGALPNYSDQTRLHLQNHPYRTAPPSLRFLLVDSIGRRQRGMPSANRKFAVEITNKITSTQVPIHGIAEWA